MTKRLPPVVEQKMRRDLVAFRTRIAEQTTVHHTEITARVTENIALHAALKHSCALLRYIREAGLERWTPANTAELAEWAALADREPASVIPAKKMQRVITPDCPRCHGALWFMPCPGPVSCTDDHFRCETCCVDWTYRARDAAWYRFDQAGQVAERIPPRPKLFRR